MPYFNLFNQSLTGKPIPVLQPEVLAPQCPHLLQQFLRRRRADRRLHGRRRRRGYGGSGRRPRAALLEELLVVLPNEGALVARAEQRLLQLPQPRLERRLVGHLSHEHSRREHADEERHQRARHRRQLRGDAFASSAGRVVVKNVVQPVGEEVLGCLAVVLDQGVKVGALVGSVIL